MTNKKQCREALTTYKVFLKRMDKVEEFLKVAEVRDYKFSNFQLLILIWRLSSERRHRPRRDPEPYARAAEAAR